MEEDFESRLNAVESGLIEQDHRLFNVLENFFIKRKKWPDGDPRRRAAAKALLWRLFFSPMTIAAAGGLAATVTVLLLYQQNKILNEQNALIQKQNAYLQQQIEEQESQWVGQRRAQLLEILYGESSANNASYNIRARSEAVRAFIDLERRDDKSRVVDLRSINLSGANLEGFDLSRTNLSRAILDRTILKNVNFKQTILDSASMIGSDLYANDFTSASLRDVDLSDAKGIGYITEWHGANILNIRGLVQQDIRWIEDNGAIKQQSRIMPPSHSVIH